MLKRAVDAWLDRPDVAPGLGSLLLNIVTGLFFLGLVLAFVF